MLTKICVALWRLWWTVSQHLYISIRPGIRCPSPGPCLTTAIWCCRKNSSQWQRSFHWKLPSHWLKFLRQRHVAVVRQGPESGPWFNIKMTSYQYRKSHCVISTMGLPILVRRHLYIESGPRSQISGSLSGSPAHAISGPFGCCRNGLRPS